MESGGITLYANAEFLYLAVMLDVAIELCYVSAHVGRIKHQHFILSFFFPMVEVYWYSNLLLKMGSNGTNHIGLQYKF